MYQPSILQREKYFSLVLLRKTSTLKIFIQRISESPNRRGSHKRIKDITKKFQIIGQ